MFAKVVFGLPVEGPFDYSIPETVSVPLKPGCRVKVNFRGTRETGYVIACSDSSDVPAVKPVLRLIDSEPVISPCLLELSRMIAEYYCCSRGEAIETILPRDLRAGRAVKPVAYPEHSHPDTNNPESLQENTIELMHDQTGASSAIVLERIRTTLASGRSCILCVPDTSALERNRQGLASAGLECLVLERNDPSEIKTWQACRERKSPVLVCGTRSAVFAPVLDAGLFVIHNEDDSLYKQDQFPHYHTREVARMRCGIERAGLILVSSAPSLTAWHMVERAESRRTFFPAAAAAPCHVIDTGTLPLLDRKHRIILSRQLQDLMLRTLASGRKVLVFLNRKGFATYAFCPSCKTAFSCPRCSINLAYHFEKGELRCRYCNHTEKAPRLCPKCNAGYVRFSGAGTEKVESELARLFPQARLGLFREGMDFSGADIVVASQAVVGKTDYRFGLVAALSVDRMLNHPDHMAAEHTYCLLVRLRAMAASAFAVQTGLPDHAIFASLRKNDPDVFYADEYASRKELDFPPFSHFSRVKLRGRDNEKVGKAAEKLFASLSSRASSETGVTVISLNPGRPEKIRGNFYWEILISAPEPSISNSFLKLHLKGRRQSGIIVTIDVDPL